MPNIAVDTDTVNVGPEWGNTAEVTAGQTFVTISSVPVIKQGDSVANHYDYGLFGVIVGSHENVVMGSTQSHVTINGSPVVINGDAATCDPTHVIVGTGFVTIS